MPERLDGTVALVTGASSGIDRATAIQLAAAGAAIAIVARRRDRLDVLAAEIEAAGGRVLTIDADLSDAGVAAAAVERTVAELGRLDTVVNAAGVMLLGDSIESPLSDWDRMVDLNLKALMYVTKAALPHLRDGVATSPRRVADVVNISSVAGRLPMAQVAIYNATKFAVTGATDAWRQEYASASIRFSVIEPGAVETELWQAPSARARYDQVFVDLELLHAEDVAEAIAYVVTNPRRVAVNEIVIRPTDQR
jgi:NADP-dependent 3-hydroxy acid dehydrogenase YdfG